MDSQTSADDNDIVNRNKSINNVDRCSCDTLSDTTCGVSSGCCAKDIVDKLMAKLEEKTKQLQEKEQANEQLLANLVKARAVQVAPGTDELKMELAIAHKNIDAFQRAFWKSFPSPYVCYNIKVKVPSAGSGYYYAYLYAADSHGYLRPSTDDEDKGYFKFEKDSDGTISIYSTSKGKYLEIVPYCRVFGEPAMFCANVEHKSKFALIFHPQQDKQQPGILVDIFSLANGCFLVPEVDQRNRLVANSPTAPSNKFLILAEDRA